MLSELPFNKCVDGVSLGSVSGHGQYLESFHMDPKDLETRNNILLESEKLKNAAQLQTSAITNMDNFA